jgi:tetratricopeptide (TPR) repeat protein
LLLNTKAISLDPLSPGLYNDRAYVLFFARRYSDAVKSAQRSLELAPDQEGARVIIAAALLANGKTAEAETQVEKLDPTNPWRLVNEAIIAGRTGRRSLALDKWRTLKNRYGDASHFMCGEIYAQLGMIDEAFKELDLAWKVQDGDLFLLRVAPFLDPLRGDPRLAALERKLAFP